MKIETARGFTLLELLFAVVGIALIAGLAFVLLSGAKSNSRDARRLSDLNTIRNAIELYANENAKNPGAYGTLYLISDNNYTEPLPCSSTKAGLRRHINTDICDLKDPLGYAYVYARKSDGTYKLGAHFETAKNQRTPFSYGNSNTPVPGWYERE